MAAVALALSSVFLSSSTVSELKEKISTAFDNQRRRLYALRQCLPYNFSTCDVERTPANARWRHSRALRVRVVAYSAPIEGKNEWDIRKSKQKNSTAMSKMPTLQFLNGDAERRSADAVVAVDASSVSYHRLEPTKNERDIRKSKQETLRPTSNAYLQISKGRWRTNGLRRLCIVLRVRIVIYSGQLEDK